MNQKIEQFKAQVDQLLDILDTQVSPIDDLVMIQDFHHEEVHGNYDTWLLSLAQYLGIDTIGRHEYLWQVASRMKDAGGA